MGVFMNSIDKLNDRIKLSGPICVGLDTAYDYLPSFIKERSLSLSEKIFLFNKEIIDYTKDATACYKLQIAYYEAMGQEGFLAYSKTIKYIKEQDHIAIGDIKRGDISQTASMYAKAHFEGEFEVDFVTLSPYMGMDSIEPYLPYVERGKGLFVLVRTSNPGAKDFQFIEDKEGNNLYELVGDKINKLGKNYMTNSGYSLIGMVLGCTHSFEAIKLRDRWKDSFFLIPGYGAQGGKGEDIKNYLVNGQGGIVNSSRAILLAYKKESKDEKEFGKCAYYECIKMRDDILKAVESI